MTELIWEGKYIEGKKVAPVRISLPFQTIETINESAADRQKRLGSLFNQKQEAGEWRNRLIWGDKKYVLPSLLPEFAGKVNLIYIDPPFNVGSDFSFTATIGDNPETGEDETTSFVKEPSIIEQKAYRDTWGKGLDSYMQWFYETIVLLRELLSDEGSIYVHLDWHIGQYAKVILDEIFGYDNFRNEIIVTRPISKNLQTQFASVSALSWGHDMILLYSKSAKTRYVPVYKKMESNKPDGYWHHFWSNADRPTLRYELLGITPKSGQWKYNKERALIAVENYKKYYDNFRSKPLAEYWIETGKELEFIRLSKTGKVENWFPPSTEKIADTVWSDILAYENKKLYATQKHEELLERIIFMASKPQDLILDCFCGSGTTAAVAEKMKRRWITCDLGRFAIHTARKRLLAIPDIKPFIIQNLGKYERQQWVQQEFHNSENRLLQEKAYKKFIAELYHATPLEGYTWIHGSKGGRMIHVGSVESPVTVDDIKAAILELWKLVGKEKTTTTNGIDFLGWDFAFDTNETAGQFAKSNKVDVKFKKIPREVLEKKAVEQGDIRFYELASLNVKTKISKSQLTITLDNFIIPPDDIPEEVRTSITHWSQWIDYWSIDWNYRDDTFHNEWQTYRTKQNPRIELTAVNQYEKKGKYTVLVKVIDILGNDTTKALQIEI
jgi:adenine-specific DNA-methyltransferase